jgi:sugar O-acyltransferase (sialic acid O-acetyltransferase NeuD family)
VLAPGLIAARRLLLIGAGGFARETLELVRAINQLAPTWEVAGLLDDDRRIHGRVIHGAMVLGPTEAAHDHSDCWLAASVATPADPMRRLNLVSRLAMPAERYATLIHPGAIVPASASVGPGSIIHASSVLTADVQLGAHVAIMPAVVLTHDDVVGDGVTFGAGACVAGAVTIERGAYVGSGVIIREHVTVGAGALLGMGSVVTRPVPAGEVWLGVPAHRHRDPQRVSR